MESKHEEAEKDYINGMTYKEIAAKYNVAESTVKSWKKRHGWVRVKKEKKVRTKSASGCTKKYALKKAEKTEEEVLAETGQLSEKMQQFCVFYVKYFNGTKAYMKAYGVDYASASVGASRLLRNVKIKNYIKELKTQRASIALFDKEDLVQKYLDIAYMDVREFAEIDESGFQIKLNPELDGTMVNQIKEGKFGVEIKLPDRMKAMEWLDKYFEVNPQAQRKKEYEKLKAQQLRQEIETNKRLLEQSDEEETHGAVLLAPLLEEEDGEDEYIMDASTETD